MLLPTTLAVIASPVKLHSLTQVHTQMHTRKRAVDHEPEAFATACDLYWRA